MPLKLDLFSHPLKLFTKIGLFPQGDIQVTSGTPHQARSESMITVNPLDRNNLIAASKKFSDPQTYRFTIGVRVSFDGGWSWQDATFPTLPEWGDMVGIGGQDASAGMTDPAVAFDHFGNAFMVGEPIKYQPNGEIDTIGMFVYKSTDGGLHWSAPTPLHVGDLTDDKSWIACDNNPNSPYYGHVYIAWGAGSPLRFARSTDHGAHWKGIGNEAPGSELAISCFAPEISVGLDGTVHIVWHIGGEGSAAGTTIEYLRSTNGGETFEPQKTIVTDVHSLRGNLEEIGSPGQDTWPHFPGATFRVITLATGCAFGTDPLDNNPFATFFSPKSFAVAWSDFREGAARIDYRTSSNAGVSFDGPTNGQPLLGGQWVDHSLHHFHPQIIATGSGVIGCAYYEYGPKGGANLIDVKLSASFDKGKTFPFTTTVTDKPWDPAIDAPFLSTVTPRSPSSESISVSMPTTPDSTCCGLTHAPAYRSCSTVGSKQRNTTHRRSSVASPGKPSSASFRTAVASSSLTATSFASRHVDRSSIWRRRWSRSKPLAKSADRRAELWPKTSTTPSEPSPRAR